MPNKKTARCLEAIILTFEGLGGVPALIAWARKSDENATAFYTRIWPRLLPLQVAMPPEPEAPKTFRSLAEVRAAAIARGIPLALLPPVLRDALEKEAVVASPVAGNGGTSNAMW